MSEHDAYARMKADRNESVLRARAAEAEVERLREALEQIAAFAKHPVIAEMAREALEAGER